jgi:hypothetical protein
MKSFKQFINEDFGLIEMEPGGVLDQVKTFINNIKDLSEDELKNKFNVSYASNIPSGIKDQIYKIIGFGTNSSHGYFSNVFRGPNGKDLVLKFPEYYRDIEDDGFVPYAEMCEKLQKENPEPISKIFPKILYFEKFSNNKFYVCIMEYVIVDPHKNIGWWNALNKKFGLSLPYKNFANISEFFKNIFKYSNNITSSNVYKRISFWASDETDNLKEEVKYREQNQLYSDIYLKMYDIDIDNNPDEEFFDFLILSVNQNVLYRSLEEKEVFIQLKKWVDAIITTNIAQTYISDCHSENYGFRTDNDTIPVIFDPFSFKR